MLARIARRTAATAGGVIAVTAIDRVCAPPIRPLSAAAASAVGKVQLYQYEICPFCHKIKALLDLHKIPYETIDVNPLVKREIKPWSNYKKVPIMLLDGEQVNDSPVIAERLLERMETPQTATALAAFRSPEALEWASWSDKELAVLLFPNITRTWSEAYEAFGYVQEVPHFSVVDKWSNQLVGAFAMWMAQGKIKKKYNIDDERAAVQEAIAHWLGAGVGDKPFAGGERPDFADVCVFGALKAIDRTAAHAEILAETDVGPWYERMTAAVAPGNACVQRQ